MLTDGRLFQVYLLTCNERDEDGRVIQSQDSEVEGKSK